MHFMFSYVWEFNEEKGFSSKIQSTALILTKKNASCKMMVSTCLKKKCSKHFYLCNTKIGILLSSCTMYNNVLYCTFTVYTFTQIRKPNLTWWTRAWQQLRKRHHLGENEGTTTQHHSNIRFTFRGKKGTIFTL